MHRRRVLALLIAIALSLVALLTASPTTFSDQPSSTLVRSVETARPSFIPFAATTTIGRSTFPTDPLARPAAPAPEPTPAAHRPIAPKMSPRRLVPAGGWPVASRGSHVSQRFGCTGMPLEPSYGGCRHFHTGVDIVARAGTKIIAVTSGRVVLAGWVDNCGGRQVVIRGANNRYFAYAHLSRILTRKGRQVRAGTVIGRLGSTGCTTGAHLHVQVSVGYPWRGGSRFVNPAPYIDRGRWHPR